MVVEHTSVTSQTNNNGTHLVCTFNNVQLSDNHTQIKVFVFDKYGGAVCFQPVHLYVEGMYSYIHYYLIVGPLFPVQIYDTIVTCDSVMINISTGLEETQRLQTEVLAFN